MKAKVRVSGVKAIPKPRFTELKRHSVPKKYGRKPVYCSRVDRRTNPIVNRVRHMDIEIQKMDRVIDEIRTNAHYKLNKDTQPGLRQPHWDRKKYTGPRKTEMCADITSCQYGAECSFAHSQADYRTTSCPQGDRCLTKDKCLYDKRGRGTLLVCCKIHPGEDRAKRLSILAKKHPSMNVAVPLQYPLLRHGARMEYVDEKTFLKRQPLVRVSLRIPVARAHSFDWCKAGRFKGLLRFAKVERAHVCNRARGVPVEVEEAFIPWDEEEELFAEDISPDMTTARSVLAIPCNVDRVVRAVRAIGSPQYMVIDA